MIFLRLYPCPTPHKGAWPMLYPIRYLSLCSLLWLPSIQAAWLPTENIPNSSYGAPAVIAVDPAGNATAVWIDQLGGDGKVQTSTKLVGESWQNPVELQSVLNVIPYGLNVAVDSESNVTAAWTWLPGSSVSLLQNST